METEKQNVKLQKITITEKHFLIRSVALILEKKNFLLEAVIIVYLKKG